MIVVSGASGVIGRALIARLRKERLPCVALGREVFASPASLVSAVSRKPSVFVHLAAAVPKPPEIPDDDLNAVRTREMDVLALEAVKQWGCHAVYASGCSLYPKTDMTPKREEDAQTEHLPSSAYLAAKQNGEREFLASGCATVLRIPAPVGPGLPLATVVGRFMAMAKAGGSLEIWGTGQREQNYVDVLDIADAVMRALVVRPRELINIAADQPITMLELAQQIVNVFGRGVVHMVAKPDPRDGEPARYSNQKAADILGWRPFTPMLSSLECLFGATL